MTNKTFRAIILDMDGTLVNTEKLWKQAERDMLSAYGRTYDVATHAQFLGMAVHEFIPAVQKAYDLHHVAAETLADALEAKVANLLQYETKPTSGATELVQYMKDNDISCAIASNSSHKMIDITLSNQRWLDVIAKRYSSDDVAKAKPAPDLYLYVASQLEVQPEECIAIEDSLTGVLSATRAGMTCFAIPDAELADVTAYRQQTPYVFSSLLEVLKFIQTDEILII